MAIAVQQKGESLLETITGFVTPSILGRVSQALGEPVEKLKTGFMVAIPAVLAAIVHKGSSESGASELIGALRSGDYSRPEQTDPTRLVQETSGLDRLARSGSSFLSNILGSRFDSVTQLLSDHAGLKRGTITSLFGLLVPTIMGVLHKKASAENFDPYWLKNYLGEQKESILAALPAGYRSLLSLGSVPASTGGTTGRKPRYGVPILIGGLVALGVLLSSLLGRRMPVREVIPPVTTATAPAPTPPVAPLNPLATFLNSGVPAGQGIVFEDLTFASGTATLNPGSMATVDSIADTLKANPNVTIRIDGHTDNTGSAAINQTLSIDRANEVKRLLVARGIASERMTTAGFGPTRPRVPNDTVANRGLNRRIELVVLAR